MIRINQIGYRPEATKICVLDHPESMEFQVMCCIYTATRRWFTVHTGTLEKKGSVYIGDFSAVQEPADYRIVCGQEQSTNFVIKKNPYQHLERLLTEFFTWQRCGHAKGWAGVCHQDLVPLCGTDRKLDMRGGYHQSGDLRCWHDGCSSALYNYMRFAEGGKPAWENGLFDEELRWGIDYFCKTVSPEGFIYDCQFVPIGWGPRDYYNLPAPLSDHYNICCLLARASIWFRKSDAAYADRCLALARRIWEYVEQSHEFDVPYVPSVGNLPGGTQKADFYWQNRKGGAGMSCASSAAAYELYKATADSSFLERAVEDMRNVLALQITAGPGAGLIRDSLDSSELAFQDCGYGYQHNSMAYLIELIREQPSAQEAAEWKAALERYCDLMVREFGASDLGRWPMLLIGTGYRGGVPKEAIPVSNDPIPLYHLPVTYTSMAAYIALVLSAAARILDRKDYLPCAQFCIDYLLGNNTFNASTVTGVGFNHTIHNVYGQFFPSTPQLPGGMVHCLPGEYDLPAAGMFLRALLEFRDEG